MARDPGAMDRPPTPSPRGRLLAIVGASGGCGASTLAAATARYAAETGRSVVLVDGAAGGAGLDVVLGIEHVAGVRWPDLVGCRGVVDGPGLIARMPRSGPVAVLAHCRESPLAVGAAAVRGVVAGLVAAVDLVVVDAPRSWSLSSLSSVGSVSSVAPVPSGSQAPGGVQADLAVVVAGTGVVELAALAATAPRVARHVPQTHLVLRGRRVSRALVDDVEAALDLPVLGVLGEDPQVARDVAHGIPPGGSRGPVADLARLVIEVLADEPGQVAS